MEREYQSGHLTVLLSTTGTGIPGSSCPTPIGAVHSALRKGHQRWRS